MMMYSRQGIVMRHPKLASADLAKLLGNQISDKQKAWYIVTCVTDTCFGNFEKATSEALVTEWTQGQVFCTVCEIRWQRAWGSQDNDVLVLHEGLASHLEGFQPLGKDWQVISPGEQATLMAWGSSPDVNAPHIRRESRLPRQLHYPIECQGGRVHYLYYCTLSGEVQFIRLREVE
jgi:hypothetical protein